jgi:hypothetical protein
MDLVFHLSPFFDDYMDVKQQGVDPSKSPYRPENGKESGMPELRELLDRYAEIVGFDLSKDGGGRDWEVATIFQYVRGATISHGIQARTISGQNSSTSSHIYFAKTKQSLDAAFQRVQKLKEQKAGQTKL